MFICHFTSCKVFFHHYTTQGCNMKWKVINSFMLQKFQNINTVINVQIYRNMWRNFWICVRVNISSRNTMVMICTLLISLHTVTHAHTHTQFPWGTWHMQLPVALTCSYMSFQYAAEWHFGQNIHIHACTSVHAHTHTHTHACGNNRLKSAFRVVRFPPSCLSSAEDEARNSPTWSHVFTHSASSHLRGRPLQQQSSACRCVADLEVMDCFF